MDIHLVMSWFDESSDFFRAGPRARANINYRAVFLFNDSPLGTKADVHTHSVAKNY